LPYLYYISSPSLPAKTAHAFAPIYQFFLNKWYFDELYDFLFVKPAVCDRPGALEDGRRADYRRARA
jgi:NADH:ubiquinone oxidoreductase subunit 5 (subunit L)/multisubunit Na+/H+ antiporter MnhA subunit